MNDKQVEEQKTKKSNQSPEREVSLYSDYDMGVIHSFWDNYFWDRPFQKEMSSLQNVMRTDIEETAKGYEFKVEVPGFERKDINISFENGYLTVAVNKSVNANQGQNRYLRRERVVNACSRSFYVGDIDQTQISASLQDGILIVTVPKEIKTQRHQVEIK